MTRFNDKFYYATPALVVVVSLIIFILGLRTIMEIEVHQYPKMDKTHSLQSAVKY